MRVQFTLTGSDELLAFAYEADKHVPISDLARSSLMSAVKREAGRSGLTGAIRQIVRQEVADALAQSRAGAEVAWNSCLGSWHPEDTQDGGVQ